MFLTSTTQTLQIVLGAAKATNDCPVAIDYVDFTSTTTTPGLQVASTNGTGTVTALSAPGASTQRKVNFLSVANKDTAAISVTIQINDTSPAGTYKVVTSVNLAVGSTLQFTDTRGWCVINSSGQLLTANAAAPSSVAVYTSNTTWTLEQCRRLLP